MKIRTFIMCALLFGATTGFAQNAQKSVAEMTDKELSNKFDAEIEQCQIDIKQTKLDIKNAKAAGNSVADLDIKLKNQTADLKTLKANKKVFDKAISTKRQAEKAIEKAESMKEKADKAAKAAAKLRSEVQ